MAKRTITAAVIWIVLALPGIFLKNPFGYFPAFAFAIAVGLSLLYIRLLKRSFTFLQTTESGRCELGKQETSSRALRRTECAQNSQASQNHEQNVRVTNAQDI